MNRLRLLIRLLHINMVLIKYGLDQIVLAIPIFAPVRFLAYLNPWNWQRDAYSRAARMRAALEELGPIFVKFGQMLSTRSDLLPEDIAQELAKLQDKVPPFGGEKAQAIIEFELDSPLAELFSEFNPLPLASASIAQVHAAKLLDGREVVVKVLRPGIDKTIRQDVDLMYTLARLAERYWSQGRRLHPVAIVQEFEHIIFDELDLMREAANASEVQRNFQDSDQLYVPEIYWPYTREKIFVMERIYGIPIADIDALKEQHIDLKKLAETGVEIFFTQVFRDCFFHADMHPGNIFVDPRSAADPRYIAVDFGIVGTLSAKDQRYLAENFLAFFKHDYKRVAELHLQSGWIPEETRLDEFEGAIRTVCEPFFQKPLKEISFGRMLMRLFQTGRRFNMEVQPQLVLLQKTLLSIEGLGRKLYPDLNLWETAKPFLEQWMKDQLGPKAVLKKLRKNVPTWISQFPDMPELLYDSLTELKHVNKTLKQQQLPPKNKQSKLKWRYMLQGAVIALLLSIIVQWW